MKKQGSATRIAFVAAVVCALAWLVADSSAQVSTASIEGKVKDASGAVVPGVSLTARNTETGSSRTVATDSTGNYHFVDLQPGIYELKAESAGFKTSVQSGIQLSVGQKASVNLALNVGEVSQSVEVTEAVPLVETTTSSLSGLVNDKEVRDLPLNGRNFLQLTLLQTGVVLYSSHQSTTLAEQGQAMSINGIQPRFNSYLLDGANLRGLSGYGVMTAASTSLGIDTVREFRVVTNSYSAEYGRTMGGVVNIVTKSGTNALHGNLFEFVRNSAFDARNFFDPGNSPLPFKRNQWGFTVGGPVKKDKTFFFVGTEWLKSRLGKTQVGTVPSPAVRSGAFAPVSPVIQPYLNLYPTATGPATAGGLAEIRFPFSNNVDESFIQGRADHNFSANDFLFGRYTRDAAAVALPGGLPSFSDDQSSINQFWTVGETHVFNPSLLNTLNLSYSRIHLEVNEVSHIGDTSALAFIPGQPLVGALGVSGLTGFGPNSTAPNKEIRNTITIGDDITLTKAKHSFKAGFLAEKTHAVRTSFTNARGGFTFTSLQNFLNANPTTFVGVAPGSKLDRSRRNTVSGFYLQDDYKPAPRLTFNLGLRYEFYSVPTDSQGRDSAIRDYIHDATFTVGPLFRNPSLKNFGPRAGFAWDIFGNGKTSLRGGFGLFQETDVIFGPAVSVTSTFSPPFALSVSLTNPQNFPRPSLASAVAANSARPLDYNVKQPYAATWNMGIQRELTRDFVLSVAYAGSRGIHLVRDQQVDGFIPTILPDGRVFFPIGAPKPNPNFSSLEMKSTDGNSWYNSLQINAMKRLSHGLQFKLAYSYAKTIDITQGYMGADVTNSALTSSLVGSQTVDRSVSDYNVGHVLTLSYGYKIPTVPSWTGVRGAILNGWDLNGSTLIQSGLPFTPAVANNVSRSGVQPIASGIDRPNWAPDCNAKKAIQGSQQQYYNPNCFVVPTPGFLGNVGRNVLRGPGQVNFDVALGKAVKAPFFGEAGSFVFRAEFFNLFNHTNLAIPTATRTVFSGALTRVNGVDVVTDQTPLSTAGKIQDTATPSRQLQFSLKVVF